MFSHKLLQSCRPWRGTPQLLTLAALLAMGLSSCATGTTSSTTAAPEQELRVVTTTLPVTNFTKAVAGDRAEVVYLVPTNVGPHDYQAKPEDVRKVAEANVLVKNGLGLEEYLDNLVANASNQNLKTIDTSEGVPTISSEETEGHSHAEADAHKHEGEYNPHIWLDPERAIQQVNNIRDGLIAADPEGKNIYTTNAAAYTEKLKALDAEATTALKPYAGKEFVTYHDFAPYFAQRYSLDAQFLVGVPEENPSPNDVKKVMNAVKSSQLKTLLTEPQAAGNPFAALAKDLNVQVSNFDPMETSGPEGIEPDYYFTVMRQNIKNLQTSFGKSTASALPARAFTSWGITST